MWYPYVVKILIIKILHFNYNFEEAWCAFKLHCQTQFFNLLIFWINSSKFYEIHWFHAQNGDNFKVPWWVVMTLEFWRNHHTILLEKQDVIFISNFFIIFSIKKFTSRNLSWAPNWWPNIIIKTFKRFTQDLLGYNIIFFVTCTLNGILCAYNVL